MRYLSHINVSTVMANYGIEDGKTIYVSKDGITNYYVTTCGLVREPDGQIKGMSTVDRNAKLLNTRGSWWTAELNTVDEEGWGKKLYLNVSSNTTIYDRSEPNLYTFFSTADYRKSSSTNFTIWLEGNLTEEDYFRFYNPCSISFYNTTDTYVVLTAKNASDIPEEYGPLVIYVPKNTVFPPCGYASSFNGTSYTTKLYSCITTDPTYNWTIYLGTSALQSGYNVTTGNTLYTNKKAVDYIPIMDKQIETCMCCYDNVTASVTGEVKLGGNNINYLIKTLYNRYTGSSIPYAFFNNGDSIEKLHSLVSKVLCFPGKIQGKGYVFIIKRPNTEVEPYDHIILYGRTSTAKAYGIILTKSFGHTDNLSMLLPRNSLYTYDVFIYDSTATSTTADTIFTRIKNCYTSADPDYTNTSYTLPSAFSLYTNLDSNDIMFPEFLKEAKIQTKYSIVMYSTNKLSFIDSDTIGLGNSLLISETTVDFEHKKRSTFTQYYKLWKSNTNNACPDDPYLYDDGLVKWYGIVIDQELYNAYYG